MTRGAKEMMARVFRTLKREMPDPDSKYDRIVGAYWWFIAHNRGQFSPEYECWCALSRAYDPNGNGMDPDSGESLAYGVLCGEFGCLCGETATMTMADCGAFPGGGHYDDCDAEGEAPC